jgi:hypothetical protein
LYLLQQFVVNLDEWAYFDEWSLNTRPNDIARLSYDDKSRDGFLGKIRISVGRNSTRLSHCASLVQAVHKPVFAEDTVSLPPCREGVVDRRDL